MKLQKISLKNFRNHDKKEIKINLPFFYIEGKNGSGKTSILEAIYFCSTASSHRTKNKKEMIKNDKPFFKVELDFEDKTKILAVVSNDNKYLKINDIPKKKESEFISKFLAIFFSLEDMKLIQGSPQDFRYFLDSQISRYDNLYLETLKMYLEVLKQRNTLLKKINESSDLTYLNVLGEKLIILSETLMEKRKEFLDLLNAFLKQPLFKKNNYNLEFKYLANSTIDKIKIWYQKKQAIDILNKQSMVGPHKDSFSVLTNQKPSNIYSSTGEKKMFLIEIKLALAKLFQSKTNQKPVLLLDDIFGEIDKENQKIFLENITNEFQIIMTSVNLQETIDKNKVELYEID